MRGAAAASLVLLVAAGTTSCGGSSKPTLKGTVRSGGTPLASTTVTLYGTSPSGSGAAVVLGSAKTNAAGSFALKYPHQASSTAVLYLVAGHDALAAVLGTGALPVPSQAVVDEQTTVAAGFAFAQFVAGSNIAGNDPGPQNAAAMAGNLVNVQTGSLSSVLTTAPNGNETSTLRTFNSLANMLVPCARSASHCGPLFRLAAPAGAPVPQDALAAVSDIARNPGHNVAGLFALAQSGPAPYRPAIGPTEQPDAWILALRFAGNGKSIDGPGNIAIDAHGNAWVNDNLTFSAKPNAVVCGGKLLFKFTPAGRFAPGSPYSGGGLNGVGYGITVDTHGNIWASNFGFASPACTGQPSHSSVSKFSPEGKPLSPSQTSTSPGGFTNGGISWPQGIVADRQGNIWIANCENNTVTRYPDGNPKSATSTKLGIEKPFDIAFNLKGQAFVTGNGNNAVEMLNANGSPARPPITAGGIDLPLGIAADSHGNMWVSNSGVAGPPCPGKSSAKPNLKPSITLISSDGTAVRGPFTGGGAIAPFGIAVDGHDNVWVANFAGRRVSEFCGITPGNCPAGTHTGQPISPSTGYGFDGLSRVTALEIDPSGNIWICDNWANIPLPKKNPGGHFIVVYIGAAGPVRTPLIGPPRPLSSP
jgi:hypothetical protein